MNQNCSTCKFYFGNKNNGTCRRFPPTLRGIVDSEYPSVSKFTPACAEFIVDGEKCQIVKGVCDQTCFHYKNGKCKKVGGVCDVYRQRINNAINPEKKINKEDA